MPETLECLFSRHYEEKFIFGRLTKILCRELPVNRQIAFLCIGIDRSTGDCFGPLTGTMLQQFRIPNIFGTLKEPVHAQNMEIARANMPDQSFVIAIDASLGSLGKMGHLIVKKGPLFPGKAMGRNLPPVGDISITMNVNVNGIANYLLLQNSSLYVVWRGATTVARSVSTAMYMRRKNNPQINSVPHY